MKFCDDCGNILLKITDDHKLSFMCHTCYRKYESEAEDTLMSSVNLKEEWTLNKYRDYIKILAKDDPTNPNQKIKCKRTGCGNNIAKVLRITEGNSNIHFYICTKCNYKFKG